MAGILRRIRMGGAFLRGLRVLALAGAAGALALACQAAAPAAPQALNVEGGDFFFKAPDSVPAGLTTIVLTNTGKQDHHIVLARLEQGKTLRDFEQAAPRIEKEGPPPWMVFVGGSGGVGAGGASNTTQLLTPGAYVMICFIPDPSDGAPHIAKGMVKPLTVTGTAAPGDLPPASDGTVVMKDYSFDMPATFAAGQRTLRVVNEGQEPHELQLMKLAPGKTAQDLLKFFSGPPSGPPPFGSAGGTNAFSRGLAGNTTLDLAPGTYVALCQVPDNKGRPHTALGMVKEFTVR